MRQRPHLDVQARSLAEKIGPGERRYADLLRRGFNKRFVGQPDYVRLVGNTSQVIEAVQEAVAEGHQLAVRSGGYCMEGLVANPEVRAIIDMSLMTHVAYDAAMGAFSVEAGTTLGELYRKLDLGWGVVLPAGQSPNIGVGGHLLGGAFGFLCREHGLAVDHLYAVEVVVVAGDGTARAIVCTRDPSDPNHDLFWAHTGGGGGNFGIVTRYWLRSPGADDQMPGALLPRSPEAVVTFRVSWNWQELSEAAFARLTHNFGAWCEANSSAGTPASTLFSILFLTRTATGKVELKGVTTAQKAERVIDEHLLALNDGVGVHFNQQLETSSWLAFAQNPFPELFGPPNVEARFKVKDAFLRRGLSERQIATAYEYLTRTDHDVAGGVLGLASYGGRVNVVPAEATAMPHRNAVIASACNVGWGAPEDEAKSLAWLRPFYRDLFADSGGVPVPGDRCDGAMINHPDVDFLDPAWNSSGVPWHVFYYKESYPRLQRIKAKWDPGNVFRHALSIRAS